MKKQIYQRFPGYDRIEVREAMWKIAERRTEHLLSRLALRVSVQEIVANAYMQGCNDTADALARQNP